jgi:hypothetical protein
MSLFYVAFIACILMVIWVDMSTQSKEFVEATIRKYQGIIVSLGTLFLVIFVGFLTTILANYYADRRESMNRKISAALAISEFRQKWIDSLRDDIAEFSGLAVIERDPKKGNPQDIEQIEAVLASRILFE